jgi:anhydro-N-acetylmuramic acid kinase
MIVAGVMSGTSADGINVALIRILGRGFATRFKLLAHDEFPYPANLRKAVLAAMNAPQASVAELSRLNFRLAEQYADAILNTQRRHRISKLDLIGCHGQTIYHQGEPTKYLGRALTTTWQIGEGAIVAARCRVPVVSDFRPADLGAGGKGAPLVPFLDYIVYRHRTRGRVLQNIGGIGNLTAIPAAAKPGQLIAFDTGPGNMLIDACMEHLFGKRFDRNGKVAAQGTVLDTVLSEMLRHPFFRRKPPKTAGREEFGREFASHFLKRCGRARAEDVVATATALTVRSISEAIKRYIAGPHVKYRDYIVAGGGAKNATLMGMLQDELSPLGLTIKHSEEFGVPAEAKEAIAFAVLAYQTWHRQPGNVPSATGAKHPAILGKISYV